MSIIFKFTSFAGVLILAGACAQDPDAIAPAEISASAYKGASCRTLNLELESLNSKYAKLAADQRKAKANDTVGVLLLGIPLATMSGNDKIGEIASVKGQQQAIKLEQNRKRCKT